MITYLISPTYALIGASIIPVPNPSKALAINREGRSHEKYIKIQAIIWGKFTTKLARLLPRKSTIGPEMKAPNGCVSDDKLPEIVIIKLKNWEIGTNGNGHKCLILLPESIKNKLRLFYV